MTAIKLISRMAKFQDLDRLYHMINTAYRSDRNWTNESEIIRAERISKPALEVLLRSQRDPIIVAVLDHQVVGCIQAECKSFCFMFAHCLLDCGNHVDYGLVDDSALIGLFAVDPDVQSRGIGRFLFQTVINMIQEKWECTTAMMFVINQRTDIQAWYERMGFVWHGEKREFTYPGELLTDDIWLKVYTMELEENCTALTHDPDFGTRPVAPVA